MTIFFQFACLILGIGWLVAGHQAEAQVWIAASVVFGCVRQAAA